MDRNSGFFFIILIFLLLINITGISYASPKFTLIYVVQEGDTLFDIAKDYGTTVDSIIKLNNISKDSWIKVGQELIIPGNNKKKWEETRMESPPV